VGVVLSHDKVVHFREDLEPICIGHGFDIGPDEERTVLFDTMLYAGAKGDFFCQQLRDGNNTIDRGVHFQPHGTNEQDPASTEISDVHVFESIAGPDLQFDVLFVNHGHVVSFVHPLFVKVSRAFGISMTIFPLSHVFLPGPLTHSVCTLLANLDKNIK
jgi:hypothetical protein